MTLFSPLLTAAAISIALFSLLLTLFLSTSKISLLRQSLDIQGNIRALLLQMISGIGKLRVAGAEKNAFSHWASLFSRHKTLQLRERNLQTLATTFSTIFPLLTFWAVYALLLHSDPLSLPDFLAFQIALGLFLQAIYPFNQTLLALSRIVPLWERTRVILQEPLEEEKKKTDPGRLTGAILALSLSFSYDHRTPILQNISINIQPRELVAIVGPSGSGKSTLIRLLLGFEKPSSGGIYYDGKDLAHLDPRAVRKQLGTVLQGEELLAGPLYDNLISGGTFHPEQIHQALELSGFAEDIATLPMGLHTYLPLSGATLSGGQKQRLFLARALLTRPSILLFDEATSALDYRTQQAITQNIGALNITRVIITQHLAGVRNADRIYVLQKGSIVQSGTFDELASSPGLFADMISRQKL
ncbi:MAG: ATP-binding cassette domain-containing protein [Verrucomicrobiota bacterium]|nr:ATP-binding cassette domain-containing protein [Verrucomicrobiota bacterium]